MVSFLKSGKTHVAGAEVISGSAFFCNKIKSPTPDPSPVGRGVDTVVFCALLLSNIIGYYTLLSNVAVG